MSRRLLTFFLFLAVLGLAWPAQAQELRTKKVAVLPVTVLSKEPLEYLGEKVRQIIQKRLQAEGFTMVPPGEVDQEVSRLKEPLDEARAQEVGRKLGAQVVVWGTLVKVGEVLSLKTTIWDSAAKRPVFTLTAQGAGLTSLDTMSGQAASDVSLRIMGKERIVRIEVKGNRRVEKDGVMGAMKVREGDLFTLQALREDLKAVYKMGYFTDVKFDISDKPEGKVLTIQVEEKAAIKEVMIKGNKKFKAKKVKETLDLKPFTVASDITINEAVKKVQAMYRDKGYIQAKITTSLQPTKNKNEVNLVVNIDEGARLYIKEVKFEGNKAIKSKELRGVLETKKKGMLSFITSSGVLNKENMERDMEKVASYYYNHGYIKAKVGEPKIETKKNWMYITIPITEGPQFMVGKVDIRGELLEDKAKTLKRMSLPKKKIYSREVLQKDMTDLADFYADHAFANADITPLIKEDEKKKIVDVTFDVRTGKKVKFDRIEITGNVKTRDKVIRRELRVYEQEPFSATKLKESTKNLRRLEYFEEVNFSTSPGSAPDRMNLKITVKERPTGTFGVGAGYSTQDKVVGLAEVSQNNLFGRGMQLKIQGIIGAISHRYRVSFLDPYLFDRPLAMGTDLFNWQRQYPEYTQTSKGGVLRFGHPLRWKYTRAYIQYRFENVNLSDLEHNASPVLKEAATIHNTSAVGATLRRDSRDALFFPTKGSDNSISVESAGLGGDTAFLRYVGETGWYYPIKWGTVGVLHGRVGYMRQLPYGALPSYEKFFLGGIDTIRGFKYADISPRDPRTNDRLGGEKFVQMNVEYRFPIYKKLGLMGTVFFDAGNVYTTDQQYFSSVRTAVGTGIRWFSPMGPLRVEWGYNLRPKAWEKHSAWEFTIGSMF